MQNLRVQGRELKFWQKMVVFVVFLISLQSYSLSVGGNGVTANYIYVFLPLIYWLIGRRRRVLSRVEVFQVVGIYTFIYVLGIPNDVLVLNPYGNPIRRLASFVVFMLPLLLSFIEFKQEDIDLFKKSVIVTSLIASCRSILAFFSLVGSIGLFDMKGAFGSQRYGFILCFGFYTALLSERLFFKRWILLQKVGICTLIFIGAVFTFARSSFVAFIAGAVFLLISTLLGERKKAKALALQAKRKFKPIHLLFLVLVVAGIFVAFQRYVHVNILYFYQHNFIDPLLSNELTENAVTDSETSEGYRLYLLGFILNYLAQHPFFGSCFQGLYLLYDQFSSGISTHNQYADVFLRTGLVGGILWLYLIRRIMRFCRCDRGMQVGMVTIIVYSLVHETFKLSHGSFLFGMLLSFSYMRSTLREKILKPQAATLPVGEGL